MATVTGLTAARMLAIEASSVVSGHIDGSDHLILTNQGGGTIDAGLIATSDMSLAGNQTVTGIKTYNAGTLLDKGSMVFNVKAYGAVGNGTTDDTAAIQSAVDAAWAAGGGTVWFPKATYKLVTNPVKLYSGTGATLVGYSNIELLGAGSIITQTSTGVDVIKCLNDVTYGAKSENNSIRNLTLSFTGTATNSGNGLYLAQVTAGGPIFKRWTIENVFVADCQGSGKYGFNLEGMEASTFSRCKTSLCSNGYFINGGGQGNFTTGTNSTSFLNCYAYMGANGVNGFRMVEATYSSFTSCGTLWTADSIGTAYLLECCNSITFTSCGFELDGTHTLANGYKITVNSLSYGSGQIKITGGYCYQSKNTKEVWVTGGCNAMVDTFQSNSTISGSTGLVVDGTVIESGCSFPAGRTFDAAAKWRTPGVTRPQAIDPAGATPTPKAGTTDFLFVGNAAVNMTVGAPTGTPDDAQIMEIWYRDNGGGVRTIAHNAIFQNGPANMVTTTVAGKNVREVFQYSTGATKWICIQSTPAGW
jgi:hypothetical protein